MTETKPHFRVIEGRAVEVHAVESKVDLARKRHGKPFAFEKGSNFTMRAVPLLTEWMATRPPREKA